MSSSSTHSDRSTTPGSSSSSPPWSVSTTSSDDRVPPPPPIPTFCDDWVACCGTLGHPSCNLTTTGFPVQICPAPAINGVVSRSGAPHPVRTCSHCRSHDRANKLVQSRRLCGANANSGYKTRLCAECEMDEVKLYWMRVGNLIAPPYPQPIGILSPFHPHLQITQPRISRINQWPARDAAGNPGLQDFCVCPETYILGPGRHCHACRDEHVRTGMMAECIANEDVLRRKSKNTINGTETHLMGRPHGRRIAARHILAREKRGIGRLCPCGNEPLRPAPVGNEYCTICMACMGVKIDPAHLPPHLQLAAVNFANARNPTRVHNARRHEDTRVNIERAWLPFDRYINWTY